MKTNKRLIAVALFGIAVLGASCGNTQKKAVDEVTVVQSPVLSVDDLLDIADTRVGEEITIEGICTHICKHSGCKIFLMGSDDTKTVRVQSGKAGKFTPQCVNSIVKVTGTLREQRIDETYLQNWEARLKTPAAEKQGEGEAGCDTEKRVRGETTDTPKARIADFRAKIAKRQAETGKNYLSFYFVEASSYEIQQQKTD